MAILIILLIFLTLLTFVFNSNANIFDNAFINFFIAVNVNKLIKIFLYRFLLGRLKNQRRRLLNRCYFFLALWIFHFDMQFLLTILPVRYGWYFKSFCICRQFFFFFFCILFSFISNMYVLLLKFTYLMLIFLRINCCFLGRYFIVYGMFFMFFYLQKFTQVSKSNNFFL